MINYNNELVKQANINASKTTPKLRAADKIKSHNTTPKNKGCRQNQITLQNRLGENTFFYFNVGSSCRLRN
jgi:hypothetical protein